MGEHHGLPFRPGPACPPEQVLKCGWLRKQRSLMKNWQLRWFVLQGNQLLYYKDEDEAKPQGFISLQGSQVHEVTPNPEELGKHLFEISPAHSGKEAGESLYARQRWLGLCLSCGGEGHKAAVCPSKKPDPPVVPASGAAKAGMAKGLGEKSLFKKDLGLQVEPREASSASEEAGGPESSEESAGNDSDVA
uniref:Uncharacterized protein n=1 Tax=Sphaerodactylus townsendi TaxID=933632 RepID=A0ACB8F7D2_9SAUR